jgi:hypothetical protein
MGRSSIRSGLLFAMFLLPTPIGAQRVAGEIPLADVLEVLVIDREILAIDAAGGGQTVARLRLDETVLWKRARGKVGIVITNQRILAAATQSAAWQEMDYRLNEVAPNEALLGDRVALVITSQRVVGFNGGSANLVEYGLGPRERVLAVRAGENVGVVVTNRRALGLSPFVGGFFNTPINLNDPIESVTADSNFATLISERRLLTFRATTGSWEERSRVLR